MYRWRSLPPAFLVTRRRRQDRQRYMAAFPFNARNGNTARLKFHPSFYSPVISVSNVSMRYGTKILFEEVSTSFLSGRRYGLTGPNGSGKSTFMKVLTGEFEAQKGNV